MQIITNKNPDATITATITSCGRLDLLQQTVNSLLNTALCELNVIIFDDSDDPFDKLKELYGTRFTLVKPDSPVGQAKALEMLYSMVETPWLFHCEDDWLFLKPGYIHKSLDILEHHPMVSIVGLTWDGSLAKYGAAGEPMNTCDGTKFMLQPKWRLSEAHGWWHGWLSSPNLKRTGEAQQLKFTSVNEESDFDRDVWGMSGKTAVWLPDQYVKHIGGGRSLYPQGDRISRTWLKPYSVTEKLVFRFHLLGLAHLPTTPAIQACAYTQKVVKLSKMLKKLGHTVFFYGGEGSEVECDRYFTVVTDAERKACYGDYDWKKEFFKHNPQDRVHQAFNARAIAEIKAHKQDDDFLLCPMGTYNKPIADAVGLRFTVESGIGYSGVFAPFKVWESYGWMNHVYGINNIGNGSWYDTVIPNYWDPDDFHLGEKGVHEPYHLYIGRLVSRKGVTTAAEATEKLGVKLVIAGQGDLANVDGYDLTKYKHIEYVGTVDKEERANLMAGATVTWVPTWYIAPFEGTHIESMFCGTPVLTTDWGVFPETNLHGITGFRCRTMNEFLWGARNAVSLNPERIRAYAVAHFSMDRAAAMYQSYFEQLWDIRERGWYQERDTPGWNRPGAMYDTLTLK